MKNPPQERQAGNYNQPQKPPVQEEREVVLPNPPAEAKSVEASQVPCKVAELISRLKGKFEVDAMCNHVDCNIAKRWIFDLMEGILGNEDTSVFRKEWTTFLRAVKANRTNIFTESLVYQHTDKWDITPQEEKRYRFLIYLAMRTCDQTTRRAEWSKIDLRTMLAVFTQTERTNLEAYYAS